MAQPTNIQGTDGNIAAVSSNGEQYIANRFYDSFYVAVVSNLGVIYPVIPAKVGHFFVITGLLARSTKTTGTNNITFYVTEEDSPDAFNTSNAIYQDLFDKGDISQFSPINVKVNEGKYVNAAVTFNTGVILTLSGHYEPV